MQPLNIFLLDVQDHRRLPSDNAEPVSILHFLETGHHSFIGAENSKIKSQIFNGSQLVFQITSAKNLKT